jgi:catechol 2,3-dioxygenase-like lactoylglutathione lyase family enzyme
MRTMMRRCAVTIGALAIVVGAHVDAAESQPLPTPAFHHLHLNSMNPDAAIEFYARLFPSTSKTMFAGQPALESATDMLVLFTRVDVPPATQPTTAFWHFGWHVTDVHKSIDVFRQKGITLLPLYVEESGGTVATSADTWPSSGGGLGLTKAGIADAKAKGVKPTYGAGFAYFNGPDDAIVEYQGNMPRERFNHVHMWMEQPFCTQVWYQTHLNVVPAARGSNTPQLAPQPARTADNCRVERGTDRSWPALNVEGMVRSPSMNAIVFSDVSLFGYMNQTDQPLASTRGHVMDHFGLSVTDLDAWIKKLRGEGVRFLEEPYKVGDHRAVMIEGPNREAIELLEIKG